MQTSRFLLCFLFLSATAVAQEISDADKALIQKIQEAGADAIELNIYNIPTDVSITATDLVLTVTQMLRKKGVVGKFVEFFGPGLAALPVTDRATLGNMAPEYGATCGFFPIDEDTLDYLQKTKGPSSADNSRNSLRTPIPTG